VSSRAGRSSASSNAARTPPSGRVAARSAAWCPFAGDTSPSRNASQMDGRLERRVRARSACTRIVPSDIRNRTARSATAERSANSRTSSPRNAADTYSSGCSRASRRVASIPTSSSAAATAADRCATSARANPNSRRTSANSSLSTLTRPSSMTTVDQRPPTPHARDTQREPHPWTTHRHRPWEGPSGQEETRRATGSADRVARVPGQAFPLRPRALTQRRAARAAFRAVRAPAPRPQPQR
jgi:hypothetical protein